MIAGWFSSDKSNKEIQEEKNTPDVEVKAESETNSKHIAFHDKLVSNLKLDHQNLLALYTGVLSDAKEGRYSIIPEKLAKFKAEFGAHITTENIKFYGYLEQNLKQSSPEFSAMRKFRRNMNNIERAVNKYLDSWIETGVTHLTVNDFLNESDGIANALIERIKSEEEKLYKIYDDYGANIQATA